MGGTMDGVSFESVGENLYLTELPIGGPQEIVVGRELL